MIALRAGQFSATVLMGLVLLYMLAYSHSNSKFDYFEAEPQQQQMPDWAKSRLDSPGWVEQHKRFIAEINAAREDQVSMDFPPMCRTHAELIVHQFRQ